MITFGPARRADVEWVELDGDAVLYDPAAHVLHRLNPEAAAVWAACDGRTTAEGIIGAIDDAYAGSSEAIARDVPARYRPVSSVGPSTSGAGCGR